MDFTKLLIGGAVAYGIYWYLSSPITVASTVTQGMVAAPLPPINLTSTTPATNNSMLSVLSTISAGSLDQAVAAGAANGANPLASRLTWEQWNYFMSKITGINGPDPTQVGVDSKLLMLSTSYYPMLLGWASKQAGLGWIGGLSGLGIFVSENQHNG